MSDKDLSEADVELLRDQINVSQFSAHDDSVQRLRSCLSYFYEISKPVNVDITSVNGDTISANGHTMAPAQTPTDPKQFESLTPESEEISASTSKHNDIASETKLANEQSKTSVQSLKLPKDCNLS